MAKVIRTEPNSNDRFPKRTQVLSIIYQFRSIAQSRRSLSYEIKPCGSSSADFTNILTEKLKHQVLTHETRGVRIADVARWALADRSMIDNGAQCRWRTVARIDTFQIATCQRWEAVVVAGALGPLANFVRITGVPIGTVASRLVVTVSGAQRVDTTLCDQTGVDAFVVDARLNQWALVVAATTD